MSLARIESLSQLSGARPLFGHLGEMNRDRQGFLRKVIAERLEESAKRRGEKG